MRGTTHNYDQTLRLQGETIRPHGPCVPTRSFDVALSLVRVPIQMRKRDTYDLRSRCPFADRSKDLCTVLDESVVIKETCMIKHRACFHYRSYKAQQQRARELRG